MLSLLAIAILFITVSAEPNAVMGILLKPFQNRTYSKAIFIHRVYE